MTDFKKDAALGALKLIDDQEVIGLGAGVTIAHLVAAMAVDASRGARFTFASPSFDTTKLLLQHGLNVKPIELLNGLDIYFDGCDQLDPQLNALKSGGGIHTYEKIFAAMATEFVLLGDEGKLAPALDTTYPLVIEVIPAGLDFVIGAVKERFESIALTLRSGGLKLGPVRTDGGNYLLDARFEILPELQALNEVKLMPGVVDHSLFYKMAAKAVLAGPKGTRVITPITK